MIQSGHDLTPSGFLQDIYDDTIEPLKEDAVIPEVGEYSTDLIAEAIYATVDNDGFESLILKDIIDHRVNPVITTSKQEAWIISHN